ncbi:MAG: hypothetical protein KIT14_11830 [bacterium]|nr:hypothetical protein [bacterium]
MLAQAVDGRVLGAAAAGARFVGMSCFNGWLATLDWPREVVAGLLPPALRLADAAAPTHPVLLLFGEQTRSTVVYGGVPMPLAIDFCEFGLAVPFVRHREGRYRHLFFPRMCSSYFPAVADGNLHYGLAKRLAHMEWRPPIFWMTDEAGRLLFHATVEPTGPFGDAAGVEAFRGAHRLADLPVLGRCAADRLVTSYFDWGARDARARPVRARLSVSGDLASGLAARETLAGADRCCEVSGMTWRLSWPLGCRL